MSTDTAPAQTMHAGRLIARRLKASGIDTVFTLSGGHLFSIYDGCREEGIRLIDTRHEQTAAFAAEGWSKVTRVPGVAALTAGPGITNGMSAMAAAQQNQSPLVVLGGRAPALRWGMGSLQEIDHVPFVAPVARFAATAQSAENAGLLVDQALQAAVSAPSGVAFVDFPMDHAFSMSSDNGRPGALTELPAGPTPAGDALDRAAGLLSTAQRPGHHGRYQRLVGPCGGGIAASCRGTAHSGADERDGARRGARRSPVGLLTGAVKSAGGG
ncbi:acetolactate synthase [Mycobacterium tuberculosis]|nr:acetolactate synthase [Mycobacterium tuberculosis]